LAHKFLLSLSNQFGYDSQQLHIRTSSDCARHTFVFDRAHGFECNAFFIDGHNHTAAITCVPWPQQQQQLPATAAAAAAIEMSAE